MEQINITNDYSKMLKDNAVVAYATKQEYMQQSDSWSQEGQLQKMTLETIPEGYEERINAHGFIRMSLGAADPESEPDIDLFWSLDSPKEIIDIFNDFARRAGWKVQWEVVEHIVE